MVLTTALGIGCEDPRIIVLVLTEEFMLGDFISRFGIGDGSCPRCQTLLESFYHFFFFMCGVSSKPNGACFSALSNFHLPGGSHVQTNDWALEVLNPGHLLCFMAPVEGKELLNLQRDHRLYKSVGKENIGSSGGV